MINWLDEVLLPEPRDPVAFTAWAEAWLNAVDADALGDLLARRFDGKDVTLEMAALLLKCIDEGFDAAVETQRRLNREW